MGSPALVPSCIRALSTPPPGMMRISYSASVAYASEMGMCRVTARPCSEVVRFETAVMVLWKIGTEVEGYLAWESVSRGPARSSVSKVG